MTDFEQWYCTQDVLATYDAYIEHKHFMKRYHKLVLDNAISRLSDVEQFVINHTYGLNGYSISTQKTILEMIYKKFGIRYRGQCQVSRIKIRAIKKLKKLLKNL